MTTALTQKQLGKAVGRADDRTIRNWMDRPDWTFGRRGPFDVEAIRNWAIDRGLYDRLGSDPQGAAGSATNGVSSKMTAAASGIALQQRMANLKLTNAKLERLLMETRAKQKDLVPAGDVFQALMRYSAIQRERAVLLRQRGNPDALDAAGMIEEGLDRFEAEVLEMFGPKGE